jgi:hypothetical protein
VSADDTGKNAGGQSLVVDDEVDESSVPTAPMRAVSATDAAPQRPAIDFDDDDDDEGPVGSRPGSTANPFTETHHAEIPLPTDAQERVEAAQAERGPNKGKVLVLTVLWLALLGGLAFGIAKAAGLMG